MASIIKKIFTGKDAAKSADASITRKMREDERSMKHSMSTLLLGAGGSGKSTVLKQMEMIHNGVIEEEEMLRSVDKIREHIVADFVDICITYVALSKGRLEEVTTILDGDEKMDDELAAKLALSDDSNKDIIQKWATLKATFADLPVLNPEGAADIKAVWAESGVRYAFEQRSKSHIMDNTPWLFERVDEIADPGYKGSFDAYVRLRDRTTGGIQRAFNVNLKGKDWLFCVTDVGGQKSERKKWFQFFENVSMVMYVVSLSSFDQVTFEDHKVRVYDDSFELFAKNCSSAHFHGTDWVIFLNKNDLFLEKLFTEPEPGSSKLTDFRVYDPEFPAENARDPDEIVEYVRERYATLYQEANERILIEHYAKRGEDFHTITPPPTLDRKLFFHRTCATDTKQIEAVILDIQLGMISRALVTMSLA